MLETTTEESILKFWFHNARPKSLPQSLFPAILALSLAYSSSDFSPALGILSILGVVAGHLGLNLFDDYFDYRKAQSNYRETMAHEGLRVRVGKCLYLTSGKATLNELLLASCIFSLGALFIGAIILYFRGEAILCIATLTAILGLSYSGAPIRFSYHGLGELLLGIIFGPLIMIGVFFSASGSIINSVPLISISVGLLIANMLYIHSILDFESDKKIGKKSLAVLLNNRKLMIIALSIILFFPYAVILGGCTMRILSMHYMLVLLSLPLAIYLFYLMCQFVGGATEQHTPRYWMGPMPDWDRIKETGIDWFMIRWYLARNLLTFFCILLILATFLSA